MLVLVHTICAVLGKHTPQMPFGTVPLCLGQLCVSTGLHVQMLCKWALAPCGMSPQSRVHGAFRCYYQPLLTGGCLGCVSGCHMTARVL